MSDEPKCPHCGQVIIDRDLLILTLGQLMSDISEECWCAGWLIGTEMDVPRLARAAVATGVPQMWGMGIIDIDKARQLCAFADALGHWVTFNSRNDAPPWYVPYTPLCEETA